ncbi:zinc-binding alcohol dehydrogenase family protein [Allocatelliglobosispora scoriae]|uniref:Zinc-type alcohol dehydrogenase-like protein n=1 Tax=Allocatelliglobosispora scoriae TaxID=643052 RepID=A0A841BM92_9ACTN|nr:zinc-binding alcohol dehydrogenase family protein [Allocatelliglobosispora scoriae]MBB5868478.1 zinc-binding alcohol dehydrogenase family protein [Allocatelliglobosispora scoriae]
MSTMQAVVAVGGDLVDATVDVPQPGPHDLLVEVRAVSVNPVDTKVRAGGGTDRILGFDAAGIVVSTGSEATRFRVGDEVYYAGDITRPGSNAQFQAVDERIVGRKPAALTFAEAAAMPLTTITAWESLFDHLRAAKDTTGSLVVVGAAGGVGSILVQLARALTGLRVIGTASRLASADWVRAMGAHDVVDHRELATAAGRLVPDGVDYLFTSYSKDQIGVYADIMRPFGQIVAIDDARQDLYPLKSKSITWHWEFMFARSMHHAADLDQQGRLLDAAAELLDTATLRHTMTTAIGDFSAAGIHRAHQLVDGGQAVGKVVVHR